MTTRSDIAKNRGKSLIQRGEESPFLTLRTEMDRVFHEFWKDFPYLSLSETGRQGAFSPRVDVTDTEDAFKVAAEVPGMDEKDFEVTLAKDSLTIKGEKKEEKEERMNDCYRMERSYGSFVRTIPLPTEIDTTKVQASLKKGVLVVTLPKTAKMVKEAKKITVKTE